MAPYYIIDYTVYWLPIAAVGVLGWAGAGGWWAAGCWLLAAISAICNLQISWLRFRFAAVAAILHLVCGGWLRL
jgi:hypothetical protein